MNVCITIKDGAGRRVLTRRGFTMRTTWVQGAVQPGHQTVPLLYVRMYICTHIESR